MDTRLDSVSGYARFTFLLMARQMNAPLRTHKIGMFEISLGIGHQSMRWVVGGH